MRPIATEKEEGIRRQRYNLAMTKIMRTSTKWSDCGAKINMFFASVSYTSDLTPFQGASPGRQFPGLKPWTDRNVWHGRDALPRDPRQHVR